VPREFLFVYGTLRSEFDNPFARRLRAEARLVGRATVVGSIFRVAEYPGFWPEPAGEVHGEVYRLSSPATLQALDEYEGPEYERVGTTVSTGESVWIYRFERQPPPALRIASGDFCAP
jgi:gamma-glutamylcyclotransferase (GGCT)/AIG2-like uncharacterized protein YtfP